MDPWVSWDDSSSGKDQTLEPVLQQMWNASLLDAPLITHFMNFSYDNKDGAGQITLGGYDDVNCGSDFVRMNTSFFYSYPFFNVSSIGGLQGNYGALIQDRWDWILVDNTTLEVFVSAANATVAGSFAGYCDSNVTAYSHSLPCDQVASAANVTLRMETDTGGLDLVLLPSDYIVQIDGACYVFAFDSAYFQGCLSDSSSSSSSDSSDGDDGAAQQWFLLGTNYMSNHCITKNILTGEVSISTSNRVSPPVQQ